MFLSEKITRNARFETNKKRLVYFKICEFRSNNNTRRLDLTFLFCSFWSYRSQFLYFHGFKIFNLHLDSFVFSSKQIFTSTVKPHLFVDSLKFYNTISTKTNIVKDFLSIHATLINYMQRDRYLLGIDLVKGTFKTKI